jgi:hypothetical protein
MNLSQKAKNRRFGRTLNNVQHTKRKAVGNDLKLPQHVTMWPYAWLNTLLHHALLLREEHEGQLTAVTFRKKGEGWLAVPTVEWKGRKLVKFVEAPTLAETFFLVGEALRGGSGKWKDSRY